MKNIYFLLAFALVSGFHVNAQVSFVPDQTSGCVPITINFTNTSLVGDHYSWSFGDGGSSTSNGFASGISHSYSNPGTFNVYMDAYDNFNNHLGSASVQVTIDGLPSKLFTIDSTICPGDETSIDIGNAQSTDITWDFGDGTILSNTLYNGVRHVYQNIGTYNVQVTAVTGCGTESRNRLIYVGNSYPVGGDYPMQMWVSSEEVCPGDEIQINGPSQYSGYYINYGDGFSEYAEYQAEHSYSGANSYIIEMIIVNGCGNTYSLFDTVTVSNNVPLNLYNYGLVYDSVCINTNVEFSNSYTGYSEYLWSLGNGQTSNNANPVTSYPLPGEYPITLTVVNGCGNGQTLVDTVIVSENIPVGNIQIEGFYSTSLCPGDGFVMSVDPDGPNEAYTYLWDFGDGNSSTETHVEHSYSGTGTYTITLTATNFCGNSASVTETITVGNNIIPNPNDYMAGTPNGVPLYCPGDSVLFVFGPGASGASVEWDFGDGNNGTASGVINVFGVTYNYIKHAYTNNGSYTATLTYTNSCGNSFTQNYPVTITNGVQSEVDFFEDPYTYNCQGQPVTFYGIGGNTLIWDFGDGSGTLITYSPLSPVEHVYEDAGTYHVTVEIVNGCGLSSSESEYVVIPESKIEINTNTIDATCGNNDGKAIAVISGGLAPYDYLWSNGDMTFIADSIPAGIYLVNVEDNNGCKNFAIATVSDAEAPTILTAAVVDVNCHGEDNGAIDISVIGNSAPYNFVWSNGSTNEDINQLEAGPHEVTVTDANGCVATSSIQVNEPGEVIVNTISENADCGLSNGQAAVAVSGSTGPYLYVWSNQSNNEIITGLSAGIYDVVVIDANGCIFEESVAVSEGNMNIVLDSISGTGCIGDLAGIYLRVLPSGNYSFDWSSGQTTEDISGLSTGVYSVEVTDINNGCIGYAEYSIMNMPSESNQICIVTVDSVSNTNRVVWEKDLAATGISHYNVYKESSQSGVYYLVDEVPYDSMSVWVDPVSNPQDRAWRYKISVVDDCGNESVVSSEHKTIHLTVNEGINNTYNLIWDHYDGLNYATYEIWRKTNSGGWSLVTSLPSNLNSWTDVTPPAGTEYYRVEALTNASCDPSRAGVNTSRSNVRNTPAAPPYGLNIEENALEMISVYPNPTSGIFTLDVNGNDHLNLEIYNSIGELIFKEIIHSNKTIDLSNNADGVFFVRIINNEQFKTFKIIKQ